jgi:ATPase involved in DNA repair/AAA domain (dynein-related subfamily)
LDLQADYAEIGISSPKVSKHTMTDSLATGTYEVLRNRLRESAADLRARFQKLNEARAAVFGNVETRLLATLHVTTEHNCIPRGLFANRNQLLLGYNVQFGLKTEIAPSDVLSSFRYDGDHAKYESLDSIVTNEFLRDFQELYKYYRGATFSRFFQNGPMLYMVFQIGKTAASIKAFKWAIVGDRLQYIDNRSESDVKLPTQHAFQWKRAMRESHRHGKHPHISIEDRVFVECVGGDLTIKVEDNTGDGLGIYREPVESPDQTLDDAETYYAILGNLILLKIRPYQERDFRYLVFSVKRATVLRLDSIGDACVLLPDDHGIMFPNGFVLQTGEVKLFDHGLAGLSFDRLIKSPNGEDFLFLFFQADSGSLLQLRYNLIRQEVDTPLVCHGQAFFDNGNMLTMRASDTPQKHHALQVWQTPFTGTNFIPAVQSDSLLFKIGNHDLVRGMAECQELLTLVDKDESYADLYADLAKRATDLLDGYFWLDREEASKLAEPIQQIRATASAAVDEFEKVVRVRNETNSLLTKAENDTHEVVKAIERSRFEKVSDFVDKLAAIRAQRGQAIQLKSLRYIDLERVAAMETQLAESADRVGVRCVQFLLEPQSLAPYGVHIEELAAEVPKVAASAAAKKLETQFGEIGGALDLLIETVSQLKIDDLAQRTNIIDRIGDCLAQLNRVRSTLKMRMRDLNTRELESDFASQSKLLDQATASALDVAETPDAVDSALTRMLMQVEELEGRYADSEELLLRLTEKRQTLCELFESRRQQLVESQTRRANSLVAAAERILTGISSRAARIDAPAELLAYFASDLMVEKVRKLADQLTELGDSVRSDDVQSKLKSISDDAMRQQRDRRELLSDGNRTIRLGQHAFSVNHQPIELTMVVRDGQLNIHLTGTQYYQPLADPELENARDLWDQLVKSESPNVYRGEYLAYQLANELRANAQGTHSTDGPKLRGREYLTLSMEEQVNWVRERMHTRFDEGYIRGVHDQDAAKILVELLSMEQSLGLLAFSPRLRGLTWFVWKHLVPDEGRTQLERWVQSLATVDRLLPNHAHSRECLLAVRDELAKHAGELAAAQPDWTWTKEESEHAADYLIQELRASSRSHPGQSHPGQSHPGQKYPGLTHSPKALQLLRALRQHVGTDAWQTLQSTLQSHSREPRELWFTAIKAVDAFLDIQHQHLASDSEADDPKNYREEVAGMLFSAVDRLADSSAAHGERRIHNFATLTGLSGDHAHVKNGTLKLHYHDLNKRLRRYTEYVVPRWEALQLTKRRLLAEADRRIKTHEFKAKVLTSFVRNQLIDEVYLPRIGDNLAKQMGSVGENKRTDRMGLLLLISPPGYGKTTLMEYIANRLGLVFVKVNGPALGHDVTSLDPAQAANASAREEVHRINTALEMGDNTLLYLDDIQHCNVELLQKFIPLCDATRRIEGVWNGVSKTYDLRGRKFVVVMAGNPYTESGERFQIPDMLANRADVYNLGEIIGNSAEAFEQSYLENCLTSNTTLQPLARCSNADQRQLLTASRSGSTELIELESNLSNDTINEMFVVLRKLQRVRDVVLTMNQAYIRSAAQADDYRIEPPFKLHGSYRNMNRIAEKVVPVMNDSELERLIQSSYQQDAQTLSRDSESNLLKFGELLGTLTPAEQQRWSEIKKTFVEKSRLKGLSGDDSTAQFLSSLLGLKDGLDSIRSALDSAVSAQSAAVAEPPKDPRVIVQHSVPRVITDLIRSQFQLLHDGLRPVLEHASQQTATSDRLRLAVEELLKKYKSLEEAAMESPLEDSENEAV